MANTYTQIHIHSIFAVKKRTDLIQKEWKDELYKYIAGIVQTNNHKLLAINGMLDHLHVFFGMRPIQSLSDLMQDIKGGSSKWINEKKFIRDKFEWQEGYGAFSYSKSQISKVIVYIQNQEVHHRKVTFPNDSLKNFRLTMMSGTFLKLWNNITSLRGFNLHHYSCYRYFIPNVINVKCNKETAATTDSYH